jgi:hypothetical protein
VGCCAAALAAGCTASLLVRRRRRQLEQQHGGGKQTPGPSSLSPLGGSKRSSSGLQAHPHLQASSGSASLGGQPPATCGVEAVLAAQHPAVLLLPWAGASFLSGASGLPAGEPGSEAAPAGPAPRGACPRPPPPSVRSSLAGAEQAAAPCSVPSGLHPPPRRWPQQQGGAASPGWQPVSPTAAGAPPLLSHLPTYGWQRCVVPCADIQFVLREGEPEELGVGASATVGGRGGGGARVAGCSRQHAAGGAPSRRVYLKLMLPAAARRLSTRGLPPPVLHPH